MSYGSAGVSARIGADSVIAISRDASCVTIRDGWRLAWQRGAQNNPGE
jgi:hypothetical protein